MIAEKYEAMVRRRELNSRVKDYYDLWLLAETQSFDGAILAQAVANTFARRGCAFDDEPQALYATIAAHPQRVANWNSFRRMVGDGTPVDLAAVLEVISKLLDPVCMACAAGQEFTGRWMPGEGWRRPTP